MPVYNRSDLLSDTLQSVHAQSFPDWELIAVDDGSIDGSFEIVRKWATEDERFHALKRSRAPKGAAACRNIGLEHARGDYVLFLDSDDLLPPTCLEERMAIMRNEPEADGVVFGCRVFASSPDHSSPYRGCGDFDDPVLNFLACPVPWFISSPVWRRRALTRLRGSFDETLQATQDWEFHLRLLLRGARLADHRPSAPFLCRRGNRSISTANRSSAYLRSYLDATLLVSGLARTVGREGKARALLNKRLRFACLRLLKHGDAAWVSERLAPPQTDPSLPPMQLAVFRMLAMVAGWTPTSLFSGRSRA